MHLSCIPALMHNISRVKNILKGDSTQITTVPKVQPKGFLWVPNGIGSIKFPIVFLCFFLRSLNQRRYFFQTKSPHTPPAFVCSSPWTSKQSMDGVIFFRSVKRPWNTARSHKARNDGCRSISFKNAWKRDHFLCEMGQMGLRRLTKKHRKATHPWQYTMPFNGGNKETLHHQWYEQI